MRHLVLERNLAASTCLQYAHAIRFLYHRVLRLEDFPVRWIVPKRPQRIPELLNGNEAPRYRSRSRTTWSWWMALGG